MSRGGMSVEWQEAVHANKLLRDPIVPELPPFVPDPERSAELPLDQFQQALAEAVERIGPARVRHCARSAFVHLRKAWRLHPVDSEMSLFRAITAEEEASSALIFALRQQNYPGADRLNPRHHGHKAAIWPFLRAIGRGVAEKAMPIPQLAISTKGEPRLSLSIDIGTAAGLTQPFWATPDHPFNFAMHSDQKGPFEVHRWERELLAIASDMGFANIRDHVTAEANRRNRILYASHDGVPSVRFADDLLLERLVRVKWLLVVSIGIVQTPQHQLFVVQGLEALLRALDRFEGEGYKFPTHEHLRGGAYLSLVERREGGMELELVQPQSKWPIPSYSLKAVQWRPKSASVRVSFDCRHCGDDNVG